SPSTVCSNSASTITLTGFTGSIQWQSSTDNITFTDISGQTASTLNTGALTVTTYFQARVTSGVCPPAFSTVATVTVNYPPVITVQPTPETVCVGQIATYTVTATGTGLTYQWRKNGANLSNGTKYSGVTTATLTVSNVVTGDAATSANGFSVVVSGTCNPS